MLEDAFQLLDPATDCPLMPPDLVERYNSLLKQLQAARAIQRLRPQVEDMAQNLDPVRARLKRLYYQVGFLGRNQIGKSTTFNNIFGVSKERAPSQEGHGEAKTSVITRLHAHEKGGDSLMLRYLDQDGYDFKRKAMCEAVGLDVKLSNEQVLEQLPRREQEIKRGEGKLSLAEDPRYLRKLVRSYLKCRDRIGGPDETGDWKQRGSYLSHDPASEEPSRFMLLTDAVIDFETTKIDLALELIDLPGLGAHVSVDSILSNQFMEDLDGALVFVSFKARADVTTEHILARLRHLWEGQFEGRVWLVFTNVDTLTGGYLQGDDTAFDSLDRFVARHAVPVSQVCLVSNSVYDQPRSSDGKANPVEAARIIGVPVPAPDAPVERLIPPQVSKYPDLVPAFKEVMADGGIEHLRDLLRQRLVPHVRRKLHEWIARQISEKAKALGRVIEFASLSSTADRLPDVQKCLKAIYDRLKELQGRTALFDDFAERLGKDLTSFFHTNFFPENDYLDEQPLPYITERFSGHAQNLQFELERLLSIEGRVQQIYAKAGEGFAALPRIPLAGYKSLAEAWTAFAQEDAAPKAWKGGQYPRFENPDLFTGLRQAEADAFNGRSYRAMMDEKIRVSVHAVCFALRQRLRDRLKALQAALEEYTKIQPGTDSFPTSAASYDAILTQLGPLCQ
jgi:hypothetical protein